jgi:hypothetical protein
MKLVKMFNKSFTITMLVIAVVSLLLTVFFNAQNVYAQAEGSAVEHNHHHHHEEVVAVAADSAEVGEFENGVFATTTKKGDVVSAPTECACGCKVYGCSKCWLELKAGGKKADGTAVAETEVGKFQNNCPGLKATSTEKDPATYVCPMDITSQGWYTSLMQIVDIVDGLLNPILIIGGTVGMIFVIILGVNFSKAESADKREEAKKRMINAIIGVVVTLLLLILVKLFTANADEIVTWINTTGRS